MRDVTSFIGSQDGIDTTGGISRGTTDCIDRESIIDRDGIVHDGSDSKGG